ncbi:MAG: sulfotransferase, partial [Actinomycetota bacterium]|nr:sulfotransferase [Actinomycetota bacterium]
NSETISPVRVGEQALWRGATAMARALCVRAAVDERCFFDVSYPDLVADPIRTVMRVYEWLQIRLEPTVAASMRGWLEQNPRDRHGIHDYDERVFDLPPDRVRAAFAGYLDRFDSLCGPSSVV